MNAEQKKRLRWVKLYEKYGHYGVVCNKCGISRPTLRKWIKRYAESGIEGLRDKSKRPIYSPNVKITSELESLVLAYREKRKLGARRIQNELKRHNEIKLSLASIHKILKRNHCEPLSKKRVKKRTATIYNRPIPGDRVQMDTCKIGPRLYQYTAIDDCSRYQVMDLYSCRTAANTLLFIEKVVEEMPFPIQRIQTDRGTEFFAVKVQKMFMKYAIKFRPNKPRSPHLNGKVERVQRTDLEEFYAIQKLDSPDLKQELGYWQHFYNWHRPHSSLGGKTPIDRIIELSNKTPFSDEIEASYDESKENIQIQDYRQELALRKLREKH